MQDFDWNALKFLLALKRMGTLASAAALLGVDETTVARRIKSLEKSAGFPLFQRQNGRYRPTEAAEPILVSAERMQTESRVLQEAARKHIGELTGTVRISAVPFMVNRFLVPALPGLSKAAPDLTIELLAESRNASLDTHEADIALRFARPVDGGLAVQGRRLGQIAFVAAGPANGSVDRWVIYDALHRDLPQAKTLNQLLGKAQPALVVNDLETAIEAVANGIGQSLLPETIVASDPRITTSATVHEAITRDIWMMTLSDGADRAALEVTKDWLGGLPWS